MAATCSAAAPKPSAARPGAMASCGSLRQTLVSAPPRARGMPIWLNLEFRPQGAEASPDGVGQSLVDRLRRDCRQDAVDDIGDGVERGACGRCGHIEEDETWLHMSGPQVGIVELQPDRVEGEVRRRAGRTPARAQVDDGPPELAGGETGGQRIACVGAGQDGGGPVGSADTDDQIGAASARRQMALEAEFRSRRQSPAGCLERPPHRQRDQCVRPVRRQEGE